MSQELSAVNKWLVQSLAASPDLAGINAWIDIVPEGEAFPCILFSALTGRDRVGAGANRMLTRPLYIVRAVGTGESFAELGPIANAIDRQLQATAQTAPNVIDGVTIRGSFREEPLQSSKAENGILYRYLGGLYRIFVYTADRNAATTGVSTDKSEQGYPEMTLTATIVNTAEQGYPEGQG